MSGEDSSRFPSRFDESVLQRFIDLRVQRWSLSAEGEAALKKTSGSAPPQKLTAEKWP